MIERKLTLSVTFLLSRIVTLSDTSGVTIAVGQPRVNQGGVRRALAAACTLAAATFVIHVVGGGASVWRPMAESALADEPRLVSLSVWHMSSVAIGLSVVALGLGSLPRFASRSRYLVIFVSLMWVGFGLCFVGTALTESVDDAFSKLPQPLLLLPVGILGLIGARSEIPLSNSVHEREPRSDSIAGLQSRWDYRDRFVIPTTTDQYANVDQVVTDWFLKQPRWLRLLSTNTMSQAGIDQAITLGRFRVGSAVGSWRVVRRDDQEIVFADSMGFMEYWVSFLLPVEQTSTVEASTAVRYLWPRSGRFYFALVRPLHRRFIRLLLTTTVT